MFHLRSSPSLYIYGYVYVNVDGYGHVSAMAMSMLVPSFCPGATRSECLRDELVPHFVRKKRGVVPRDTRLPELHSGRARWSPEVSDFAQKAPGWFAKEGVACISSAQRRVVRVMMVPGYP